MGSSFSFLLERNTENRGRTVEDNVLLPESIIGKWTVAGYSTMYEFSVDGEYYRHDNLSWSITPDGQTLTFGNDTFSRTAGSGANLQGTWFSESLTLEVIFRSDNSYTGHWYDTGDEYLGSYAIDGSNVEIKELRAAVATNGAQMTFSVYYGGIFVYTYLVDGNTLTITDSFNATTVYNRVI